jgi:hypothetical protein
MKCCICQKGLNDGIALFCVNAKGVTGIWVCEQHLSQTDAPPVDEDFRRLMRLLGGNRSG